MNLQSSRTLGRLGGLALILAVLAAAGGSAFSQAPNPPVKVTVQDEQAVVSDEVVTPIDPMRRINYGMQQQGPLGVHVTTEKREILHLSHFPTISVDGQLFQQGAGGRVEVAQRPLPRGKGRKDREGFQSIAVFGDIRITATVTVEPTKPATKGAKRQLNSVLVHYLIENKGAVPHKAGLRVYMDVYVINNDGAMFAAPNFPGKILDGIELKGKTLPPYVQMLQVPNLQAPGYVAHMTFDLGSKLEKPERVVLTRHGAGGAFGGWDMPAMASMGDSACGVFWQPKEIKPGGKREVAYGYGGGIVTSPESEGRVETVLGGSFEPGKVFSVTAYVTDPAAGQSLTLVLPDGMELVEGKASQPVPDAQADDVHSMVLWRARVVRPGRFPLRIRSSTGVTQGKIITVEKTGG
jgi:hypothetical protein